MTIFFRTLSFFVALICVYVVASIERLMGIPFLSCCLTLFILSRFFLPERIGVLIICSVLISSGFFISVWIVALALSCGYIVHQLFERTKTFIPLKFMYISLILVLILSIFAQVSWDSGLVMYIVVSSALVAGITHVMRHRFKSHTELIVK